MKIFIRHPLTNLYHGSDGEWVKDLNQARQFDTTTEAVKFIVAKQLGAYEILMKHPTNSQYDIVALRVGGGTPTQTKRRGNK